MLVFAAMCVAVLAGGIRIAAAHPLDGKEVSPLPERYGQEGYLYPAEWSSGELAFTRVWPDRGSLTDAERYVIAGTEPGADGLSMAPWYMQVFQMVLCYYSHRGELPAALSEDVLREVLNGREVPQEMAELSRSPITGEFPRLDAKDFARGQIWAHVLTPQEVQHIASLSVWYHKLWVEHVMFDTRTQSWDAINIQAPFFLRFYGERGVIYEQIYYPFTFHSDAMAAVERGR